MPFGDALLEAVADVGPPGASGGEKKNYTEKISAALPVRGILEPLPQFGR